MNLENPKQHIIWNRRMQQGAFSIQDAPTLPVAIRRLNQLQLED
jgi:hypothetical protein